MSACAGESQTTTPCGRQRASTRRAAEVRTQATTGWCRGIRTLSRKKKCVGCLQHTTSAASTQGGTNCTCRSQHTRYPGAECTCATGPQKAAAAGRPLETMTLLQLMEHVENRRRTGKRGAPRTVRPSDPVPRGLSLHPSFAAAGSVQTDSTSGWLYGLRRALARG